MMDNEPTEKLDVDQEAVQRIQRVKEEMSEAMGFHMSKAKELFGLAKQHEYAAQQFRILATAGDPVPEAAPER